MVPTQSYHLAAPAEIHDRLENAPAIRATADVVAKKDERVLWARLHLTEESPESITMPVDANDWGSPGSFVARGRDRGKPRLASRNRAGPSPHPRQSR